MAETWRRYLRFWRANVEQDVDDEVRFHVEMREREYIAAGLSPDAAHAEALRRFGNVEDVRESCYRIGHQRERRMRLGDFLVCTSRMIAGTSNAPRGCVGFENGGRATVQIPRSSFWTVVRCGPVVTRLC